MDVQFMPPMKSWRRTFFLMAVLQRRVPVKTACEVLGIKVATGYRWRRDFLAHGGEAVADRRYGPRKVTADKVPTQNMPMRQDAFRQEVEDATCRR
ncbi:MAG: helix-turn-helix domain-containing protein [Myxococcales bacterium]|nr:MAG: helix-turn-helix domain-containing protein [Myxococcales bacterium]